MIPAALTGAAQILRSSGGCPLAILIRSDTSVEDAERDWNRAVATAAEFALSPTAEPAVSFGQWELFLLEPDPELFAPGTILEEDASGKHYIRRWIDTLGEDPDEWLCLETTETFSSHEMLPWGDFTVISLG